MMKFKDTLEGFQDKKFLQKVAKDFDPLNNAID